jgi:hypothetical protein
VTSWEPELASWQLAGGKGGGAGAGGCTGAQAAGGLAVARWGWAPYGLAGRKAWLLGERRAAGELWKGLRWLSAWRGESGVSREVRQVRRRDMGGA